MLVRWVGPRIKELLRNKDDLPERTITSIATLKDAEDPLWALPADAKIRTVNAAIASALGTIGATKYLFKDLDRAGDTERHKQLTDAKLRLEDVIFRTEGRFLLGKRRFEEECQDAERELTRLIKNLTKGGTEAPEEPNPDLARQGRNLIPGTYDSPIAYSENVALVELSGDLTGVDWTLLITSPDGEVQTQYSGRGVPGRDVREYYIELEGEFYIDGGENMGFARVSVRKNGDGNWTPRGLLVWPLGLPETPTAPSKVMRFALVPRE